MFAARQSLDSIMGFRARGDAHPGMLLQRFLHHSATGDDRQEDEKDTILEAAIESSKKIGHSELYKKAFQRWERTLPELSSSNCFKTLGRTIIGLGTSSVLETGIRLQHTYGFPLIPGSALKGLASHYCHEIWGIHESKFQEGGEYHNFLFGTTENSGGLIFHDAWFVPGSDPSPLRRDVMTPHHPEWLDGKKAPTDFDSPVPVPFLSVSGQFLVAVAWNETMEVDQAGDWINLGFVLVKDALEYWGIGGKTSSGYGRLREVEPNKRTKPFSASALGLPKVGSTVEVELLDAPKKGKPWRAKFLLPSGNPLNGPIDGEPQGEMAKNLAKGNKVNLIVTQIGENSIKFIWPK